MEGARSFHETAQQQRQRKSVRGCRWSFQADRRAEDCGYWKGFSTTRPIRGYRTRLREPAASPGWLSKRLGFARSCSFRRPSSAGSQYLKFTRNYSSRKQARPKIFRDANKSRAKENGPGWQASRAIFRFPNLMQRFAWKSAQL